MDGTKALRGLCAYSVCQKVTASSEEHRSFLRRGAMAARFHGEQRRAVAIPHRRSDLNCFSRSRVLCSLSVDGPDGQGHRQSGVVLQQCLELCWSLCNLTASHRWLHAGSVHHLASIASSWAASSSAAGHEAVLYAFVSRVLCGTAVSCVCMQVFSKTSHSPRVTTLLVDVVNYCKARGRSY